METISIYYPDKKNHVTKYIDEVTDVFTKINNNNKKSYLIETYSFNNNVYVNIKLLLELLKKDSDIYLRLLKVLEKLENSKNKYRPSRKVRKKICLKLGSKFYRYFSIQPFEDRYCKYRRCDLFMVITSIFLFDCIYFLIFTVYFGY